MLETDAGYVSLVASRRRADVIVEALRARACRRRTSGRSRRPAGIDIGAVTPGEIAVSILAEVIQHAPRRDKLAEATPTPTSAAPTEALDPICGMTVEIATARYHSQMGRTLRLLLLPALQGAVRRRSREVRRRALKPVAPADR